MNNEIKLEFDAISANESFARVAVAAFVTPVNPTLEEIAAAVGASKEEVAASIEAGAEVESLYKTINQNDENGLCLLDKIVDQDERQEKLLNHMVLEKLIGQLGEKEKEIIVRRYYHNQTQTQVANALDISQVQVSRLEKKILKQMREQF